MERLAVDLAAFGSVFQFRLNTRPLTLSPDVTIQYCWMDPSRLRSSTSPEGIQNVREIIGLYRQAVYHLMGDEESELLHVAAAIAHTAMRSAKSTQQVLRDAFLSSTATRRERDGEFSLSSEDTQRIDEIISGRDRVAVAAELDRTLEFSTLSLDEVRMEQGRFESWIGEGVQILRHGPVESIQGWLDNLVTKIRSLRQNGAEADRRFLNALAYECKASFYHCYTNVWTAALIPWLIRHEKIDEVSQRFMAFWHMQQAAIEIPAGVTSSGILYPTQSAKAILGPDGKAYGASWKSERIGPDHQPAVFRGQVLALHPLSGVFMSDPACLLTAARFFAGDDYDFVFSRGGGQLSTPYWDLVRAILESAIRYRNAQRSYEEERSHRRPASSRFASSASEHGIFSEEESRLVTQAITEILRRQNRQCPVCKIPWTFDLALEAGAGAILPIHLICPQCRATSEAEVSAEDLAEELNRIAESQP